MEKLLDLSRGRHGDEQTAALAAAHVAAFRFGWRIFGPYLRSVTNLQDILESELRQKIAGKHSAFSNPTGAPPIAIADPVISAVTEPNRFDRLSATRRILPTPARIGCRDLFGI
ncbi:hypothetical protein [Nocardia sp. bgisy118]|uniref:hypothetical protein n=1 Tax=Nocardia sp. bgisy118 TaxID=3413786 RepID=UPI003F4A6A6E